MEEVSNKNTEHNNLTAGNNESNLITENKRYIDPECYNDDLEESQVVEKLAMEYKPYFSPNALPSTLYMKKYILPSVYEALIELEKIRPRDPVEFFAAYLLDKNNKVVK